MLGALKLQEISFSNFMTFSISTFDLISTALLYKFPLMQHVVRTVRKSPQRRAFFIPWCVQVSIHSAKKKNQIFIIANSRYYAEACNAWRSPSPRLSAGATQLQRNVAAMASRWRHCVDLTDPRFEFQTYRTESVSAKQLS